MQSVGIARTLSLSKVGPRSVQRATFSAFKRPLSASSTRCNANFFSGLKTTVAGIRSQFMGASQSNSVATKAMAPGKWPPEGTEGELATFAGGCFWGTELRFQRMPGVLATSPGYIAGDVSRANYDDVCTGTTGHAECVQMVFDPKETTYQALMDEHFKTHDSTTKDRQGGDVGPQYRSGVYYHNEEQKKLAEEKCASIPGCTTEIQEAGVFTPAEEYHQKYLEKGGRFGRSQSAAKGCTDPVRCYG